MKLKTFALAALLLSLAILMNSQTIIVPNTSSTTVTSAGSLTNGAVAIGQGGTALGVITPSTTTTNVLFATAGGSGEWRDITVADLPASINGGIIPYSANHTLTGADCNNWLSMSGSSLTFQMASPPPSTTCPFLVINLHATTVLAFDRNTLTVNGAAANPASLPPCDGVLCQAYSFTTDGTNYFASLKAVNTATGAYSALPAAALSTAGKLYFPTDSYFLMRDSGTAQAYFGPIYQVGNPNAPTWTAFNSASITTTFGTRSTTSPAGAGRDIKGETFTVPATPYSVVFGIKCLLANFNFSSCGVIWTDAGTVNITAAFYSQTALPRGFGVATATDFAGAGTTDLQAGTIYSYIHSDTFYIKLADDGANKTVSQCLDPNGKVCQQIYTTGHATTLTPTKIGYMANTTTSNTVATVSLFSVVQF